MIMQTKYILLFIILLSVCDTVKCQNSSTALEDSINYAFIKFNTKTINLDSVKTGSAIQQSFKFYNTGKIPLIIKDVKSSYGCTVVSFQMSKANNATTLTMDNVKALAMADGVEHESESDCIPSYTEVCIWDDGYCKSGTFL